VNVHYVRTDIETGLLVDSEESTWIYFI